MRFILKPFSEIIVKSKSVRKKYLKILEKNLYLSLNEIDPKIVVKFNWDKWDLFIPFELDTYSYTNLLKKLSRMPWLESFLEVEEYDLIDFDEIYKNVIFLYRSLLKWKSFSVRVKRSWKHNFISTDLEKIIWRLILEDWVDSRVDLKNPDIEIKIEIIQDKYFLVKNKYFWVWWYPVWTQDKVLSLISWWFDSSVSTFSMMKRWAKVDYLFFNLWWKSHEYWVKEVSNYLWKNFSFWYKARFITINFEEVVNILLKNINHKYRWIILKRLFLYCANSLSKEYWYYAIIKWDSLWQVSSQTLKNMFVIDKISETLVLRPLISFNKQEIIDISKKIWTHDYSCNMPEYCWVISDKPSTWANLLDVLKEEEKIDFSFIDQVISKKEILNIDEINFSLNDNSNLDISFIPWSDDVIIDIREEVKEKEKPLLFKNNKILKIPFFDINYEFKNLDQSKTYLFYCERWILSKNHGEFLFNKWFKNIKIFRPILNDNTCRIKTWK